MTSDRRTLFFQKWTSKHNICTPDLEKAEFGKDYNQGELHLDVLGWKGSRTPRHGYKKPLLSMTNTHRFITSSLCFSCH